MGKSILREKRERRWASAATYSLKNKQPGRVACTVLLLAVVAAQRGAVPFGGCGGLGRCRGPGPMGAESSAWCSIQCVQ